MNDSIQSMLAIWAEAKTRYQTDYDTAVRHDDYGAKEFSKGNDSLLTKEDRRVRSRVNDNEKRSLVLFRNKLQQISNGAFKETAERFYRGIVYTHI